MFEAYAMSVYTPPRMKLDGDTVAEAVREGRLASRCPGNPTWLAYSVYAHPNARVVFETG